MKIEIPKSAETIKKEELKLKIETLKEKSNPTNKDLMEILLEVLDRCHI